MKSGGDGQRGAAWGSVVQLDHQSSVQWEECGRTRKEQGQGERHSVNTGSPPGLLSREQEGLKHMEGVTEQNEASGMKGEEERTALQQDTQATANTSNTLFWVALTQQYR